MPRILAALFALVLALPGAAGAADLRGKFRPSAWNGTKPAISKGVVTFTLQPGACGKRTYGDGRGESDCNGGRLRSQLQSRKVERVGRNVEYRMEFFVPASFSYDGDRGYPAYSRLLIAEWKRDRGIKNHMYEMLLDSIRGATFERKVCVPPARFGQWNSFRLRIRWSKGGDGYIEAYCNGRLILSRSNSQTVIPPDCAAGYKLQCDPDLQEPDGGIIWAVGPNFSGYGRDYRRLGKPSPFAPLPKAGVRIQMRNLEVVRLRG